MQIIESISFEDMSYVANNFPHTQRESPHPSQQLNNRTKMMIIFMIPGEPVRFAGVRVPRSLPIFKVRPFIAHCEQELLDTYARAKRVNFVLTAREFEDNWSYSYILPLSDVVFV